MTDKARHNFPKGLIQPETGFRFSTDSLLLSSFVSVPSKGRILDLGTGCGVIPLGLALRNPDADLKITGIDINPEMVESAQTNIDMLGFSNDIKILECNVSRSDFAGPESFDIVVSNPPYWCEGRGRSCSDEGRNKARFEIESDLDDFTKTADRMVKHRGKVCFVFLAERVTQLLASLTMFKLEPKRIKFVHSRINKPAKVVMVEAVKKGKPGLIVEPPLVLFEENGEESIYSSRSLEYCPFIKK